MNCARCGADLSDGARFCGRCGLEQSRHCPECGSEASVDDQFCGVCGVSLTSPLPAAESVEAGPGRRRVSAGIAATVVALLALGGGAVAAWALLDRSGERVARPRQTGTLPAATPTGPKTTGAPTDTEATPSAETEPERPSTTPGPTTQETEPPGPHAAPSRGARGGENERFAVAPCGSIVDYSTGLEWFVGPDVDMTWKAAVKWVAKLKSCGGGWRTPRVSELHSLFEKGAAAGTGYVKAGKHFPAQIDPVFSGIGRGSWVWTGKEISVLAAAAVNLYENIEVRFEKQQTTFPVRAFAVRPTRPS